MSFVIIEAPWKGALKYLVCVGNTLYRFNDNEDAHAYSRFVLRNEHEKEEAKTLSAKAESNDITSWRKDYAGFICCNKAFPVFCVCKVSFRCPEHFGKCVGSHD